MRFKSLLRVDVRETARQLGVRYLLLGSVQGASDQVRVSTRLVDAVEAHQIWRRATTAR